MGKIKQLVRFDWFVKNLLRNKVDFEILEGFLSELLKEDVKIIEVVESEANKKDKLDKFNRVDVLVKTAKDERIIIEIQNTKELDYLQRILFGTSKTLSETIKEGEPYIHVKKVISVSVVYFELGQGEDYVYYSENNFIGIHKNDRLKLSEQQITYFNYKIQTVEEIFPYYYLIRAADFDGTINDGLDEWIYFFKTSKVQGKVKAKGLSKAKNRLDIASLSDQERAEYEYYLNSLHSEASYNAQVKFEAKKMAQEVAQILSNEISYESATGMAQEIVTEIATELADKIADEKVLKAKEEIANSLLLNNTDIDLIISVTNLPKARIITLKKQLEKK